eukprot:10636198-Karenia_brevis.AAC.1
MSVVAKKYMSHGVTNCLKHLGAISNDRLTMNMEIRNQSASHLRSTGIFRTTVFKRTCLRDGRNKILLASYCNSAVFHALQICGHPGATEVNALETTHMKGSRAACKAPCLDKTKLP